VWEWVEDCLHNTYEGAPKDGSAWLNTEDGDCTFRVIRGGSWTIKPVDLRTSSRTRLTSGTRYDDIGFRLAQDIR
ncbi:MAG: SUMF1/EgtB/PvdO family nonheme iron enzyme, partial [Nitrospira sp.]|nr:SUMF1/EgtB/PvdO family nonheme iron enzyme [Nitrospira sp.]